MFLLLILLVSPAFGRPSSGELDVEAEVTNHLDIFANFHHETGKLFLNSSVIETIVKMLLEAETNILEMHAKLKKIEKEEIQFVGNYFPKFNEAKSYLRQTRQGLRKLADRTVKDVRDLKILLDGLDESSVFLNISINRMKDLMIETLETLKEAKEKYNSALETFDNLNFAIKSQNIQLEKLVTESSDKYKNLIWVRKTGFDYRTVLGPAGAVTTSICIYFDILGALGICSAINAVAIAVVTPVLENEIAKKVENYRAEFENMKEITDKMLESGNGFDQAIKVAIAILNDEIDLIGVWNQRAKVVSDNVEIYSEEILREFKSVRNIFIGGLDDLKKAAEKFLDQPKDILDLDKN